MCTFQKRLNEKEIGCYYSKFDSLFDKIPLDERGLCIFHSNNETWKMEHNFILHLETLITRLEEEPPSTKIFLEDIIFTGNIEHLFNNRKFKKDIKFNHSVFKEAFTLSLSTFEDLDFNSTIFNKGVSFTNISVKSMMFDHANFKSKLSIDKSNFHDAFYMLNADFNGGVSIMNSTFHHNSFFQNIKTNLGKSLSQVRFRNIHFKKFTTFESSEFNALVDFKQITVYAELFFHKTKFNYTEPLPIVSSVTFEQIKVKEKGRLEFRGTINNKMFDNVMDVSFREEEIEGKLLFEHTNFTKFNLLARERLINATKAENAKVFIGLGCIKYYNQTPLKSIEISADNKNLVIELCNTFVDYFTRNGGFNLGVQFVSKTDKRINFFYFSDEVIPYDQFESQLQKSEQSMWRLIKIESDNLTTQPQKNSLPSKVINATDTIINLIGLVLKIGSRFPFGLISEEEISGLLHTTLPANTKLNNGIIVNQIVLFGRKNTQSFQVKKLL